MGGVRVEYSRSEPEWEGIIKVLKKYKKRNIVKLLFNANGCEHERTKCANRCEASR